MAEDKNMENALNVYNTLCGALDARGWHYEKDEERLSVYFGVNGEDIPMKFVLFVDAGRQLVRLLSPLSFQMSEDKRIDGAIATCVASFGIADGNFDYNISNGQITFRMTASFQGSIIGEGLFQYMISLACAMVDKYNDKFLAIDKGILSISDFISSKS